MVMISQGNDKSIDYDFGSPAFNTRSSSRKRRAPQSPDLFESTEDQQNSPGQQNAKTPISRTSPSLSGTQRSGRRKILWRNQSSQKNDVNASSLKSTAEGPICVFGNKLKEYQKEQQHSMFLSNTTCSTTQGEILTLAKNTPTQSLTANNITGPFFGLPLDVWELIKKYRGIADLYQWQEECLLQAVEKSSNLLYSLPTSGGKTLVAEILMLRELLCSRKNCLYVLPYVSIVQEKVRTLSPLALALGFAIEEYAGNRGSYPPQKRVKRKVIYIATLEKAHGLVTSLLELGRLSEIGLVIVDEVHIIGEPGRRGAVLETLICKLLLVAQRPRMIAMSATVGNLEELAAFLKADVFTGSFRPVMLEEYVKTGETVWRINDNRNDTENLLQPHKTVPLSEPQLKKQDPDSLGYLVAEVVPQSSCLVFCATKRNCESVAQLVCKSLGPEILEHRKEEKRRLLYALQAESGQLCRVLKTTVPFGVAYHHSGLTADERQLIEEAFLSGVLSCLCCTSTLAAGVNLPARRVILRSAYMGTTRLSRGRYQQMIGRAGRAGLDSHGESILIVQPTEIQQIVQELIAAPVERIESQLGADNTKGLQLLILSTLSLDLAGTNKQQLLETLIPATLLGQQKQGPDMEPESLLDKALENLKENKLILEESDRLAVTKLGKAAVKGCIELSWASRLYADLRHAQAGLVLLSKMHLLYLVTPYDLVGSVRPLPNTYLQTFSRLSNEEQSVARTLGINEAMLVKLMSGQRSRVVDSFVVDRFYLTLMLNDLWKGDSLWNIADLYGSSRGDVQNLLSSAASFASCVYHFTRELDEFWAFSELLDPFSKQLSLCCTSELVPLMELPAVRKGRARLIYKSGFKTLADVARADPETLVRNVEHLPRRVAQQIVAAARRILVEKADALREEADDLLALAPVRQFTQSVIDTQSSDYSLLD